MLKKLLTQPVIAIICFTCFAHAAQAQWTSLNTSTTEDLYAVQWVNSTTLYAAGSGVFLKSQNSGSTWTSNPLLDEFGIQIIGSIFLDIHFSDANNGVATGWIYAGNSECIFTTNNGGLNWTLVNLNNDGNWPRQLDDMDFPTASIGYAVGNNGRILKTQNGGQSWNNQVSGVNWHFHSVDFISASIGFAVGSGGVLRTTNGGASWTPVYQMNYNMTAVSMADANTGYVVPEFGPMLKTTNGGLSWQELEQPYNYAEAVVAFSPQDILIITAGGALKSNTSGQYWEYYQSPGTHWMHDVAVSGNKGCVVADGGKAWIFENQGGPAWPLAAFTPNPAGTICPNTPVLFDNQSNPAYTFSWIRNGQVIGNAYDLNFSFPTPDQVETIIMIAFNGVYRDTVLWSGYVEPIAAPFPINPVQGNGPFCPTTQATIIVPGNTNDQTVYQLFVNSAPVGAPKTGNFGALTFSYGPAFAGDVVSVKATRTTACGVGSQFFPVQLDFHPQPVTNFPFTVSSNLICAEESITLQLGATQPNHGYQLIRAGTPFGDLLPGEGNALTFPPIQLFDTTLFGVKVQDLNTGCQLTFPVEHLVQVTPRPEAYFTFPTLNPEIGESVEALQASVDQGGSYQWFLGGAAPQVFNGPALPALSFDQPGVYPLVLVITSPNGCVDSLWRNLHVPEPANGAPCKATQLAFAGGGFIIPNASAIDLAGNQVMMIKTDFNSGLLAMSGRGDTLWESIPPIIFNKNRHYLIKISPNGVPKWFTKVEHESVFADVTAVTTDPQGNIYAAYFHAGPFSNVDIYSTDGRKHPLTPQGPELSESIILLKYDPNGRLIWNTTLPESYATNNIAVELDAQGNVYLMGRQQLAKISPDGQRLWTVQGFQDALGFADINVDPIGNVYAVDFSHLRVRKITPDGQSSLFFGPATYFDDQGIQEWITSEGLRLDDEGNVYVAGHFVGGVMIGNVSLSDPAFPGPPNPDSYVVKLTPSGAVAWVERLKNGSGYSILKGFDVENGKVGFYSFLDGPSVVQVGTQPSVQLLGAGHFLWTLDTDGDNQDGTLIHEHQEFACESTIPYDNLHINPTNNTVSLMFDFHEPTEWGGITYAPAFGDVSCDQLIVRGDFDCFSIPTVSTIDVSKPMPDIRLFPNPVSEGLLQVENNGVTLESLVITDQLGRQRMDFQMPGKQIDISSLESGLYFASFKAGIQQSITRFVVIRQ